ncbi:MAG: 50S ribosomal protein L21 [Mycoplasmataceae bacterium CE_OT135]|nr:MAG: 50S ribosomal protein L21 [Mycoplasmataceae bacterium CE_OT135]
MYIFKIRGQVKIIRGQESIIDKVLSIDYQKNEKLGNKIVSDKVLVYGEEFGKPYLNNIQIITEVVKERGKDKKIIVFKYKAKKRYKKKQGHRQQYTRVKITGVERKQP